MVIIGITGSIGHGKSSLAEALVNIEPLSKHFESFFLIAEVVNKLHETTSKPPIPNDLDSINKWLQPLPGILQDIVHIHANFDQIAIKASEVNSHPVEYEKLFLHIHNLKADPNLLRQTISEENKASFRPILQFLGGYLVKKLDSGIWYKEILRRMSSIENSHLKLCVIGGLRFPADANYVHQAGGIIINVLRPSHSQNDALDPTERERQDINADITLVNNGTLNDLAKTAKIILGDIQNNKTQKTYYAKALNVKNKL